MNHPEKVVAYAKPLLAANERVFYCRYEPHIVFTASDNVSKDLDEVRFISILVDGFMMGIVHTSFVDLAEPYAYITERYAFKDFIEIDFKDPTIWK